MKKRVAFFMAIFACAMIMLSSCSKSADALLDEYGKVISEMNDAVKKGDSDKFASLQSKYAKLTMELAKKDLTPEQMRKMTEYACQLDVDGVDPSFFGLDGFDNDSDNASATRSRFSDYDDEDDYYSYDDEDDDDSYYDDEDDEYSSMSADALITELGKVVNQMNAAIKRGDANTAESLSEKAEAICERLGSMNLSSAQQTKLINIINQIDLSDYDLDGFDLEDVDLEDFDFGDFDYDF